MQRMTDGPGAEESLKDVIDLVSMDVVKDFEMDDFIARIYTKCPFLGYIFSNLESVVDWSMSTIGVTPDNKLLYNPRFLASLPIEHGKYILLHECLHKINNHFRRADAMMWSTKAMSLWDAVAKDRSLMHRLNVAMDLSINQICDRQFDRPAFGLHIDNMEEDLKPFKEWEYYFKELENVKLPEDPTSSHDAQSGEPSDGEGGSGEPSDGEGSDADTDAGEIDDASQADASMDEFMNIMNKAKEMQDDYDDKHGVSACDSIVSVIPDENVNVQDRKLWKGIINKGFGSSINSSKEFTIKRPSRRNKNNPIGKVHKKYNNKTVVIVDTSMSCLYILDKFFGVINRAMRKYRTKTDVIMCTTEVYEVVNDIKVIPKDMKYISGGTDMTKAQEYISKNYPNEGKGLNVVMITDGITPWDLDYKYTVSVIYTTKHVEIPGIKNSAIMEL
jgi:predicted metal-dependent peptidase